MSGASTNIYSSIARTYQAGKEYPTLQIMLPMVSTLEEVRAVKTLIHAQAKLLGLYCRKSSGAGNYD